MNEFGKFGIWRMKIGGIYWWRDGWPSADTDGNGTMPSQSKINDGIMVDYCQIFWL